MITMGIPTRMSFGFLHGFSLLASLNLVSRPPTLYGVPKIQEHSVAAADIFSDQQTKPASSLKLRLSKLREPSVPETSSLSGAHPLPIIDASKEADTVSNCSERKKNVLKIKVKQPGSSSSSKADDIDHLMENSRGGQNETDEVGPATSVSVDAPTHQEANKQTHAVNQNIEEVNSCHVYESRMTASLGSSMKLNKDGVQELQCTADSMNSILGDQSSPVVQRNEVAVHHIEHPYLGKYDGDGGATLTVVSSEEVMGKRKKEKKRDKEKKRKRVEKSSEKDRNDPEYLEHKRQKKEKKRLEKELARNTRPMEGLWTIQ